MKDSILVMSACFGNLDTPDPSIYCITEKQFPLRDKSMTPRLQSRIVKTHMWQFASPDIFIWVDSSCRIKSKQWFLDKLGEADIAVFKHPNRKTVQDEADYLKYRLAIGCPYITPRYEHEDIDGQLAQVSPDQQLYASTAFICRNNLRVQSMFKDWWYHISRWHSIDQLSLPHILETNDITYNVIPDNYLKCEGLEYVRK